MARCNRMVLACGLAVLAFAKIVSPMDASWFGPTATRLIGVVELCVVVGLFTRWRALAGWFCVAIGVIGVTLGIMGWSEACGCAGPIKLSHAEHSLLASAIGGLGVGVAMGAGAKKMAPHGAADAARVRVPG